MASVTRIRINDVLLACRSFQIRSVLLESRPPFSLSSFLGKTGYNAKYEIDYPVEDSDIGYLT